MAKTRKHGIRAPHIPPKENPAVTIANQERQIKVLIDRCEELRKESDINYGNAKALSEEIVSLRKQSEIKNGLLDKHREQYAVLSDAYSRLSGWRDCAREMLGTRLDTTAPGA